MKKLVFIIFLFYIATNVILAQKHFVSPEDSVAIDQQLDSHFGVDYEITDYIFVDSLEEHSDIDRELIDDEYGTLDNCIVFTAEKVTESFRNVKGIVGVYKNGQIIWYSDYIIPDNEIYGNGFIYSIEDINNDGKVEIMTEWEAEGGMRYQNKVLYVHSWDGNQGILVVDVSKGYSPIDRPDTGIFKIIDVQGDGVFEIVSIGFENVTTVYEWNGNNYVFSETAQIDSIQMFFPRNNFTPIVTCVVTKNDNNYTYEYTVKNSESSAQSINEFDVYGFDKYTDIYGNIDIKDTSVSTDFNKWYGARLETSVTWYGYKIKPLLGVNNLIYKSNALPIIGEAYLRGYNYQWSGDYRENTSVKDYLNNSVIIKTIAAKLPPEPFIHVGFIDTLTTYTDSSYALGWITDEQTKDKYNNYFANAKTYLQQGDSSAARAELEKVLTDCNIDSSTVLTSEAYALLYFNTEYLVNKLPEVSFPQNGVDAKVKVKVIKKKNGNLKFKYKVKNKPESTQNVSLFYLKEKTDTVTLTAPEGWKSGEITTSNLIYFEVDSTGAEIQPGENLKWFKLKAKRLPYVANYYIQSAREVKDTNDIYTNSATGKTLSAKLAPTPFTALSFIDTLQNYTTQAYNLGWIKKEKIYNKLSNKLNKAKEKLESGKERKAKRILRKYVKLVRRRWNKRKITSEGLALLKFNGQYLIKHIGPPDLEDNLASVTVKGVERLDGETRKYKYKLHNSVNNTERIYSFYIGENVENYTLTVPEDWTETAIDSLNLFGYTTTLSSAMLEPDKKKSGYEMESESLPSVVPFYILTENQPTESDTILYGSITGFTLGAGSLPSEFDGLEQTDNLYEYVEEANDLGWIKSENVYDKLLDKVNTIRKKIEKGKTEKAKEKLSDFSNYVQDKYEEDKLTKEARILLKQNANYIKRNL